MSVSLQLPVAAPPFRTSPSGIARYFFLDCQRFLRFNAASPRTRRDERLPTPEFDHSPLIKAVLESGFAWEKTVVEQHLGQHVFVAPGDGELHTRRFDWNTTLQLLREAPADSFIYQPTLRLPLAFYERYGIDPQVVVISDNHPDLIAVRDDGNGGRVLRVMDVKRGEALHLTHRVQVLLYALELEAILWAQSIDDVRVDMQKGEVWLGSQTAPSEFDLADLRPHIESFLRRDLTTILRAPPEAAHWHVYHRCEWCDYFDHCREQMQRENDVSRVSHLTAYGKQFLRNEANVSSVTELGEFLQNGDADEVLSRCASLAGRGPRLERQVAALETREPQTHGAASPSLAKGENIGLFLTLQKEPLAQTIYLAGIHLTIRKDLRDEVLPDHVAKRFYAGSKSQPFVLLAKTPDDVSRIRREWVGVLYEIIVGVDRFNQGREWREQLSLQAYVLTEEERGLLVEWLLESLQDADEFELAEQAMTLLFHFQAPELMVADSHPDREVPFPVVVLLDALGHVMALPVEVSYTLPESLESLGSRFRLRRNDYFHFPLGHGMRAEPIHAAWYRGKHDLVDQIESQAAARLRATRELLQSIRHRGSDAIYAWAAKFALPTQQQYADPLLSRLAFFARYESLLDCLDKRHTRCEPHAVQLLLGRVIELRAQSDTEFEIVSGHAMPINDGGFPEWLLVSDNEAGRRSQLEYRDYACRKQLWTGKPQPSLVQEAEFIYGLNRLNVAVTRARSKCVVFLPRPLLDASPQIWDRPEAIRGLPYMRDLVAAATRCSETSSFDLEDGATAEVIRVDRCFEATGDVNDVRFAGDENLRQFVDEPEEKVMTNMSTKKRTKTKGAKGVKEAAPKTTRATKSSTKEPTTNTAAKRKATTGKPTKKKATARKTAKSRSPNLAVASLPTEPPDSTEGLPKGLRIDSKKKTTVKSPAEVPAVLANLNEQQQAAAMHGSDPLLIIAGAGTGKTTTLVHRVAHLIAEGVPAHRILLLTFTRRSANEMLQRVADVLREQDVRRNVWGGTFHGVGTRLLRMFGEHIGVDRRFTIHDRGDAESLMQAISQELALGKGDKKFPKKGTCMSIHSYMVNAQLSLEASLKQQFSAQQKYADSFAKLFAAYGERKRELNVFDYDDLLVKWCELLEHEQTGPMIRDRFDCVLVDEYQDTNCLQSRLLKGLCPDGSGLTIVGDDAQSIYSFRAATVRNILDFPKQFPGTQVIALEQNYRSVAPILAASNSVISQASQRYTKDLWSEREEGSLPQLITCTDEHEQVEFVIDRIHDHRQQGIPLSQQAVLFRSAHHSILLEAELAQQDLAYVKYGGLKFVESAHVKDLMSFLRLAENPRDRVAGQRVLTLLDGVGPKKAMQLQHALSESDGDFAAWSATKPPAKAADDWPQMVSLLQYLAKQADGDLEMQIQSVLTFYEPLMEGRYDNLPQRLSDLEQLKEVAGRFEDRATMLADLALDPPEGDEALPDDADRDRLVLSTLHSAKGLEWKVVYVLHASDGKIPHERSIANPDQLEEERRMFYVAMTRAADSLYVCHPRRQRARQYGGSYYDDWYEQTELTRFITKSAKRQFEQQDAGSFVLPTVVETPKKKRTRTKKAAAKTSR